MITFQRLLKIQKNKSKQIWSLVKSFTNQADKRHIGLPDNLNVESFSSYFIDKVDEIVNNIPHNNSEFSHYLNNVTKPNTSFKFKNFTVEETFSVILKLNNSSSMDVYDINSKILKLAADFICEPLTHIFNYCIESNIFPDAFKYVKITPVYKKGNRSECENYRPISIIPCVSKVFEMLLNTQICKYFEDNSLFAESQFGFRKSRSTTDAVLSFVARCLDGFETGNSVCGSFFDLSKAFDTVSHSILLKKTKLLWFH